MPKKASFAAPGRRRRRISSLRTGSRKSGIGIESSACETHPPTSRRSGDGWANVAGSAHETQPLARQAAKRALDVCGGSTRSDLALFAVGRRLARGLGLVYPTTT